MTEEEKALGRLNDKVRKLISMRNEWHKKQLEAESRWMELQQELDELRLEYDEIFSSSSTHSPRPYGSPTR